MELQRLQLYQFRNYSKTSVRFSPQLNVFTGSNGSGKTNILEALYVVARFKSFRAQGLAPLTMYGKDGFSIKIDVQPHAQADSGSLTFNFHNGNRTLKYNEALHKGDHVFPHLYKVILFTNEDYKLIQGGAPLRRAFMDQAILHYQPQYRKLLTTYQQALRNRNKDIKRKRLTATWDDVLVKVGTQILCYRETFLHKLCLYAEEIFAALSGKASLKELSLAYVVHSRLRAGAVHAYRKNDAQDFTAKGAVRAKIMLSEASYRAILAAHRVYDQRRGYTIFGPHSDELVIKLRGHPARTYASQGESRTLAHALKLSVLRMMQSQSQAQGQLRPLVLLDDIFSELDNRKLSCLLHWVGKHAQAFITCAHAPLLLPHIKQGMLFKVEHATIQHLRTFP